MSVIFKIDANGTGYVIKHKFSSWQPYNLLANELSDSCFFGDDILTAVWFLVLADAISESYEGSVRILQKNDVVSCCCSCWCGQLLQK